MPFARRLRTLVLLAAAALTVPTGCAEVLHELQPHRLWRLNRGENHWENDAMHFSVADPLPGGASSTEYPTFENGSATRPGAMPQPRPRL